MGDFVFVLGSLLLFPLTIPPSEGLDPDDRCSVLGATCVVDTDEFDSLYIDLDWSGFDAIVDED
jgi:hypothetical protein